MKNLGIKLLSIFIVLLFCLSPLGAIDLNQGDNATHINNTNNWDMNDVNDTIKVNDRDMEIKKVNETVVDLDNDEGNLACKNLSLNDSNSCKNTKYYDLGLHVKIDDCDYGQSPVQKIWCTDKHFVMANFDINVTGPGYYKIFTKLLRNNAEVKLSDDLAPGTYKVTVQEMGYPYGEDSFYTNNKATVSFTVKKLRPKIKAEVKDVELGKKPVVEVKCDESLKGNITINSNCSKDSFTVDASHSYFFYELANDVSPGDYYCVVSYSGDDIHESTMRICFFKVYKHDPNFSVHADDIVEGDKIVVKFHADRSLNCNVNYTVLAVPSTSSDSSLKLGTMHSLKFVNGEANATLENNLPPGKYFVSANCEDDDKFKEAHASTEFKINPA